MFLGSKVLRMRKADNLTAICEPIVSTRGSQRGRYRPPVGIEEI
jgi:hypothetical protein